MNHCTADCWTPKPCPDCGREMPPRGRSLSEATYTCRCVGDYGIQTWENITINPRHLFDENDSDRAYFDKGWAAKWEADRASKESE